jgi:predicted phosphodiesterase
MRIIHFSDIHLSSTNYEFFINEYLDALITDLRSHRQNGEFDLVVITGDLVNCGGHSLYDLEEFQNKEDYPSPFHIFSKIFIEPISDKLRIHKSKFIFVPGNHDVQEDSIKLKEEYELTKSINEQGVEFVNQLLRENSDGFKHSERIRLFKSFEDFYHTETENYYYTNNESCFTYESESIKYGFLLLNDSWRCKSVLLKYEHDNQIGLSLGLNQLYHGLRKLSELGTKVNICLMHHPIEKFSEQDEIEGFFSNKDIDLVLYGDLHDQKFSERNTGNGKYISSRSRSTFNNHNQSDINYMCGYQILEINDRALLSVTCNVYDGDPSQRKFFLDTRVGENGVNRNKSRGNNGFLFFKENQSQELDKNNFKNL